MKKAEYLDPQGLTITICYPPWTRKEVKKSKEQDNMLPTIHFDNLHDYPNAMRILNDFNDELKRKERANAPTQV